MGESRTARNIAPSSTDSTARASGPLDAPDDQRHGNHRSRDREGRQAEEVDQGHGERRNEATAEDGTRDDLAITVTSDDIRLPRGVDHVQHHEAGGEHAL